MDTHETRDERIRLLLVDDHPVVRAGLERILSQFDDMVVVGAAETGERALALSAQLSPDVVLLDLALPDVHGLDLIAPLVQRGRRSPRVLVLTVHDDDDMALRAVRAGADGYVLKSSTGDELVTAIRRVAQGGQYFDAVVVRALLRQEKGGSGRGVLSERELAVLRLVAAGRTNKEIATELFVSVETVKAHLENTFRKLGAADRTSAVAIALREGLLD